MKDVVLITGAGNGIGFFMSKTLLEEGYRVGVLDISQGELSSLSSAYSDRLLVLNCDVSDAARVQSSVETVIERWRQIDVLINNACIAVFKPFEEKSPEATRREFDVNYFGYLHTIAAVLPHMKARGKGIIHNVSSGVGITGFPGIYGYASTKGAVESLTRTLALELEPYGISAHLMHPPLTRTHSAAPLGIPPEAMDDPERVGRRLAKRIFSSRFIITPDFRTSVFLFFAYRHPRWIGKLLAALAERSRR